jgi:segregation and condensation protein B
MEFDPSATVETVIELDENGQPIIQPTNEVLTSEESISEEVVAEIADDVISEEISEEVEEVTPEPEDKSDEQK